MINKIVRKIEGIEEYADELKVIYKKDEIEVTNYHKIININELKIILLNLVIDGVGLKVIYQDPIKIKIKGKINNVSKNNKSTI